MPEKTIAGKMAAFGSRLRYEDLPERAVYETKRRIIDSLGCALGAYSSPPVEAARALAPGVAGMKGAHIIGNKTQTSPEYAAFVNGVMVRYLDFNDTYLSKEPAHPSDNIPAALTCAAYAGRSGKDLITAVAAAYEIQLRLCDAASLRVRGWDHVAYGSFSTALAASMLLGLTNSEIVHALGIAGTTSPALRQTRSGELSMWKGCAFAYAAKNAVFAALAAKAGITGPAPVFEGEFGFIRTVSGEMGPLRLAEDGHFKIVDTYVKYYPAEYHSQSAIAAAVDLSREVVDDDEIESVKVYTFRAGYEIIGSGPERWRPKTRETADHSLPYCVAVALIDGTITMSSFSDERLADERTLKLLARTEVEVDPDLDAMYPKAIPNRVEVTLKSGMVLSREVIYPKGHPKNPLSDAELGEKFRKNAGWYFAGGGVERALDRLWEIDKMEDATGVFDIFSEDRAGAPHGRVSN